MPGGGWPHRLPLWADGDPGSGLFALECESSPAALTQWLGRREIAGLNVAGPREPDATGIYHQAFALLTAVLD